MSSAAAATLIHSPRAPGFCDNFLLDATAGVQVETGQSYTCAPWEPQGLTPAGVAKCLQQRYPWESATPNAFWVPAPDTCTGMPEESNRRYMDPNVYATSAPAPGCTGVDLAPNCPAGSTHQGCTGVPRQMVWATETASVTVSTAVATGTVTRTARKRGVVHRVTKKVTVKRNGRSYTASRTVRLYDVATQSVTASVTLSDGTATRTSTMSCSADAIAVAQACAVNKAAKKARAAAVKMSRR